MIEIQWQLDTKNGINPIELLSSFRMSDDFGVTVENGQVIDLFLPNNFCLDFFLCYNTCVFHVLHFI